jgi:hypothetical protein
MPRLKFQNFASDSKKCEHSGQQARLQKRGQRLRILIGSGKSKLRHSITR